jgi:hypothetical protein
MSKKTSNINSGLNINIKAPFPPTITANDLLSRPNGTNKRVPCAFIIYRMSLHREYKSRGFKLSWRQFSPIAANAWRSESDKVKQAYVNLSNETKARYNESSLQDQVNSITEIEVHDNNNADFHMTNLNELNYVADPYEFSENIFINSQSTFNNYITTDTEEINDNFIVPESSSIDELRERIRILEERLNLVTEYLGIQFM